MSARRTGVGAVVAVLAGTVTLSAPSGPTYAAPAFVDADTVLQTVASGSGGTIGPACVANDTGAPPASGPVPENGGPVNQSAAGTTTVTYGGNPIGTMSLATTARGSVTSVSGVPRTISLEMSAHGSSSVVTTSDCVPDMDASSRLSYHFVLPVAGVMEVSASTTLGAGGQFEVSRVGAGSSPHVTNQDFRWPGDTVTRVFLPAGGYDGHLFGGFRLSSAEPALNAGSFSAVATFTPAGAQTEAPSGKAAKYVTLPGSVTCGTSRLSPTATTKKKRIGKVKEIVYFVDDRKVQKVKHPKKGEVTHLAVTGTKQSTLRAVVTLEPKAKGKKPKELSVTARYEACS